MRQHGTIHLARLFRARNLLKEIRNYVGYIIALNIYNKPTKHDVKAVISSIFILIRVHTVKSILRLFIVLSCIIRIFKISATYLNEEIVAFLRIISTTS